MQDIFTKRREAEKRVIQEFIKQDQGKLRKELVSDFNWVKDVLNTESILRDCKQLALSKLNLSLRYHTENEAFIGLAESSCRDIHMSAEYTTWLEASKSVFAERSVTGVENRIYDLAVEQAKTCLSKYPVDTNLNRVKFKKDRDNCLLAEWPSIEGKALKEFESDPMVMKFKIDVKAVKDQLEVNRRRLQLKVMKEYFN